jgi:hypothetical protein
MQVTYSSEMLDTKLYTVAQQYELNMFLLR